MSGKLWKQIDLQWEKMAALVLECERTLAEFEKDINRFVDGISRAS